MKDVKKVAAAMARAKALTSAERSKIAKEAATVRWAMAKPAKVANVGNFIEHFGVDVDCYVLKDAVKTAVISHRGMGAAIGFSQRGDRLTVFVNSKTMVDYIGRDLREKLENPISFQILGSAASIRSELNAGKDKGKYRSDDGKWFLSDEAEGRSLDGKPSASIFD